MIKKPGSPSFVHRPTPRVLLRTLSVGLTCSRSPVAPPMFWTGVDPTVVVVVAEVPRLGGVDQLSAPQTAHLASSDQRCPASTNPLVCPRTHGSSWHRSHRPHRFLLEQRPAASFGMCL